MKHVHELRLAPAVQIDQVQDGRVRRHQESHFLDLVVDGVSLRSSVGGAGAMVTGLHRAWLHTVQGTVDLLLGQRPDPELSPGRIPVLLCSMCGDLGCGSFTVRMEVDAENVRWSDWQWENRLDDPEPVPGAGDIRFRRADYAAVLAGAYERVAALPDDRSTRRP